MPTATDLSPIAQILQRVDSLPAASGPLPVEVRHVYMINGLATYQAARDLARRHGPLMFPAGAVRTMSSAIIAGNPWLPVNPPPAFVAEARAITRELRYTSIPDAEDWAIHLVRLQIEDAHCPLLASELRSAADQVERRVKLSWLRGLVNAAFAVAMGEDEANSAILLGGDTP
jgi:hypothetical protein